MPEGKIGLGYAIVGIVVAFLLGCLLVYGTLELTPTPTPEELKTVKIGWLAPVSVQMPLIASKKGFDEEFGFKFELVKMGNAPDAMLALLAGDLDITFCAFLPAQSAFLKGVHVKCIIMAYYGGHRFVLLTKDTTGITRVEDLVGKTIAVPGLAAPPELFVRKVVAMHGISPDSINLIQLAGDVIFAALTAGEVDAAMHFEPMVSVYMAKEPGVVVLARGDDIPVINYYPAGYFMTDDFIKENNELAYKIYLALAKAQWYTRTTGPGSDEVLSMVEEATGQPASIFKPVANKNVWDPRLKPCGEVSNWETMKFFVEAGKLTDMVPASETWFNGFYERACIEHPELFEDLDEYLQALKEEGTAKDQDLITDFNEYLET